MWGTVTSYSGMSLVVNITVIGGGGTKSNWTISISGAMGATGPVGAIPCAAAGGSVDAITATYSPPITLTDQNLCAVVLTGPNLTTTPTFSPNGLTAHTITKRGGQAVLPSDLQGVVILAYNAAGTRWELLNPAIDAYAGGLINMTAHAPGYSIGTVYHNTLSTAKMVVVSIASTNTCQLQVKCDASSTPSTVVDQMFISTVTNTDHFMFWVPAGYYYQIVLVSGSGQAIEGWTEYY
jgi:hypothetical protein